MAEVGDGGEGKGRVAEVGEGGGGRERMRLA